MAPVPTPWAGGVGYGWVGPMMMDPRWLDPDPPDEDDLERALLDEAAGVGLTDAQPIVRTGHPVEQICAVAEANGVDVIVVATRSSTGSSTPTTAGAAGAPSQSSHPPSSNSPSHPNPSPSLTRHDQSQPPSTEVAADPLTAAVA